jgi:hypothetical protein
MKEEGEKGGEQKEGEREGDKEGKNECTEWRTEIRKMGNNHHRPLGDQMTYIKIPFPPGDIYYGLFLC